MTTKELVLLSEDDGTVVALSNTPGAPFAVVFLTTGETLWVNTAPRRFTFDEYGDGRAQVRVSVMAERVIGAARVVSGRSDPAPRVPLSLSVTLAPAVMAMPSSQHIVPVRMAGSLTVGSVFRTLRGLGWSSSSPAAGLAGCRARAVFQDRSGVFLADDLDGGVTAAAIGGIASRPVPARRQLLRGDERGPAHQVRYTLESRRPVDISAEIRDTQQYLTVVEPAGDEGGWRSWSAAPAVFVRSGITGLGLVERFSMVEEPETAPTAAGLPDPY